MKRNKITPTWSSKFAYAMGLFATDGCMYNDGRHFDLTSKDEEQLHNFMMCLDIKVKIGHKRSGYTGRTVPHIQFGSVALFKFMLDIGFTPAKTKTMGAIDIPDAYFFDFLRGHLDGDGCFYSYWDPRWKSSFMYYLTFISASKKHIEWLRSVIEHHLSVTGHLCVTKTGIYQLRFAKADTLKIVKKMYHQEQIVCLSRKRLKIERALGIIGERL